MVTAHRPDQCDFARCPGIADPVRFAAGADQIAPAIEIEQVHRQRDRSAALSTADFEDVEVPADQANPDEIPEHTSEAAFGDARSQIALSILGHLPGPSAIA